MENSHNPYFNRWFSAIKDFLNNKQTVKKVTILILIDGFLQYWFSKNCSDWENLSQSLF